MVEGGGGEGDGGGGGGGEGDGGDGGGGGGDEVLEPAALGNTQLMEWMMRVPLWLSCSVPSPLGQKWTRVRIRLL